MRRSANSWWRKSGTGRARSGGKGSGLTLKSATDVNPADIPLTYSPTRTSNPSDPRTAAMGYDRDSQTMVVEWEDGGPSYWYGNVTPSEWRSMRRVGSPGQMIEDVFNYKPYGKIS